MQPSMEEVPNPSPNSSSEDEFIHEFCTNLKIGYGSTEESGEIDHGGDEDEEFSFVCAGTGSPPIAAEDAFINGQIRPVYPLFNRDLLLSGEDSAALRESLPMRPPVRRVFVETTSGESDRPEAADPRGNDDGAAGPYCEWSDRKAVEASPEVCRKSNSTGFSKIWRFKDLLGRSNSDGRDAFVFLNHSQTAAAAEVPNVKDKVGRKEAASKGKAKKGKTASLSAHEAYLRSKAKEEERRRSYLPYRPELMGFFTNVNGGLTKNVHPF